MGAQIPRPNSATNLIFNGRIPISLWGLNFFRNLAQKPDSSNLSFHMRFSLSYRRVAFRAVPLRHSEGVHQVQHCKDRPHYNSSRISYNRHIRPRPASLVRCPIEIHWRYSAAARLMLQLRLNCEWSLRQYVTINRAFFGAGSVKWETRTS